MKIYLVNKNDKTKGEWVNILCEQEELTACLERIGANDGYTIEDSCGFCGYIVQKYDDISLLRDLAELISNCNNHDLIEAIFEYLGSMGLEYVIKEIENRLKKYVFRENITSEAAYGKHYTDRFYPKAIYPDGSYLVKTYDYESIGHDFYLKGEIYFTSKGCLEIFQEEDSRKIYGYIF